MQETWTIPRERGTLVSLAAGGGTVAWALTSDGTLFRLETGREATVGQVALSGEGARLVFVAGAPGARLWVVWRDATGERHAGLWDPSAGAAVSRAQGPAPPRTVVGPDRGGRVWFLGMDTGLYRWVEGRGTRVDQEGYNALVMSEDGDRLLARRVGSDDVVVANTDTLDWRIVRADFPGDLVGFGPDGAALLLETAVWRKGEDPPVQRVVAIWPGGPATKIARGPCGAATTSGERLLTACPGPEGSVLVEARTPWRP